jgi:hypothetical protein
MPRSKAHLQPQLANRQEKEMSDRDRKKLLKLQRLLCVHQDSDDFERLKEMTADVALRRVSAKRSVTNNTRAIPALIPQRDKSDRRLILSFDAALASIACSHSWAGCFVDLGPGE